MFVGSTSGHPDVIGDYRQLVDDFIEAGQAMAGEVPEPEPEPEPESAVAAANNLDTLVAVGYKPELAANMLEVSAGDLVLARQWLDEMGDRAKLDAASDTKSETERVAKVLPAVPRQKTAPPTQMQTFEVNGDLNKFQIILATDRRAMYKFELGNARLSAIGDETGQMKVELELGNVSALDTGTKGTRYEQIVGMADDTGASYFLFQYEAFGNTPPPAGSEGLKSKAFVKLTPMRIVYLPKFADELIEYLQKGVLGAFVKSAGEQAIKSAIKSAGEDRAENRFEVELHQPTLVFPLMATSSTFLQVKTDVMKILKIGRKMMLDTYLDGAPTTVQCTLVVDYCGCQMPLLRVNSDVAFFTTNISEDGALNTHASGSFVCDYFDNKIARWEKLMQMDSLNVEFGIEAEHNDLPGTWTLKVDECERCSVDLFLTDAFLKSITEAGTAVRVYDSAEKLPDSGVSEHRCSVSNMAGLELKFKAEDHEDWTEVHPGGSVAFVSMCLDKRLLDDRAKIEEEAIAGGF